MTTAQNCTSRPYGSARVSEARKKIASCVSAFEGAFTVEDLAQKVHAESGTASATATVYRAVAAMEGAGYLERVGERDGSALYTHCPHQRHHHHIVCEGCGSTAPAQCPIGHELLDAAKQAGFTITSHSVTLYGLCPDCSERSDC